ncbi:hypothetical protein SLS53_001205 [Cytospora paraplurivora]|uniref:GYF domain-containing protein n=1 Tax=Cytospora paraplurivora TaxID=2898453 RepID=A0AAN9USR2_9PEZI
MSSRYAAARPKRDAESFARTHHGERPDDQDGPSSSKRVKFDVRNPSALAPDANDYDDDDDAVLEADVIGKAGSGATKRGAVNIDGYDSDSDNETFNDRAEARKGRRKGKGKGKGPGDDDADVDIAEQLDNYDENLRNGGVATEKDEDDEDEDMFASDGDDPDEEENDDPAAPKASSRTDKKAKEVRFLDNDKIQGQEQASKSGGHIHLDERDASSDDEEDVVLAIQEEGIDEEVGLGGLKRNAPKIDAFNMKDEQEEGAFDEAGNFIRKAVDPDAVHDRWLEGLSKKDMKKAREAHEKREAELRRQRKEDDSLLTQDLLRSLIVNLEKGEAPLEALARLGKVKKQEKKIPKWKLKKQKDKKKDGAGGGDAMDVDHAKEPEDPEQVRIKEAINVITEAADKLLGREYAEIYETEREMLIREWQNEAGERWREPTPPPPPAAAAQVAPSELKSVPGAKMWEYRWTDGRDGESVQGPYDGPTMKAWQDAGYFDGVEFRAVGDDSWSRVADFV